MLYLFSTQKRIILQTYGLLCRLISIRYTKIKTFKQSVDFNISLLKLSNRNYNKYLILLQSRGYVSPCRKPPNVVYTLNSLNYRYYYVLSLSNLQTTSTCLECAIMMTIKAGAPLASNYILSSP